jgi:hypothetical protein
MASNSKGNSVHEEQDCHHPPYTWLGAAVLFWGMVAFSLAPMLWTLLSGSLAGDGSAATSLSSLPTVSSGDDWMLWKVTLVMDRSEWTLVHPYANETACEDARMQGTAQKRDVARAPSRLMCLPWRIDPYRWMGPPDMKEHQP